MSSVRITEFLKDSIEPIVKNYVDSPNQIDITVTTSTTSIILQIKAARSDYGKVIGKSGKTIEALKLLTSAIKNTHFPNDLRKISIEVLDDDIPSFTKEKK